MSLHKDILAIDFLYEFIPKLFLLDEEQDKMVIKDIVNTSLKIPYDQVWKFYNSLDDSTQKIKKLFLNCGKYFSAEVSYFPFP